MDEKRVHSKYYSIDRDRLNEITAHPQIEWIADSEDRDVIRDILLRKSNSLDRNHQQWLDTAPISEIVAWVDYTRGYETINDEWGVEDSEL